MLRGDTQPSHNAQQRTTTHNNAQQRTTTNNNAPQRTTKHNNNNKANLGSRPFRAQLDILFVACREMVWLPAILGVMSLGLSPPVCAFGVPGQAKTHGSSGFETDLKNVDISDSGLLNLSFLSLPRCCLGYCESTGVCLCCDAGCCAFSLYICCDDVSSEICHWSFDGTGMGD